MNNISAVIRVQLGTMHNDVNIDAHEVKRLMALAPWLISSVQPLSVEYQDLGTGLIVRESHFKVEGQAE